MSTGIARFAAEITLSGSEAIARAASKLILGEHHSKATFLMPNWTTGGFWSAWFTYHYAEFLLLTGTLLPGEQVERVGFGNE